MPEQSLVPFGGLDLDKDIARIKQGDYKDALDITFVTDEGGSTVSAENQYGNEFKFRLGIVVPQVKKFTTDFSLYVVPSGSIATTNYRVNVFRSNGLLWFTFVFVNDPSVGQTAVNFQNGFLANIANPAFPFNFGISSGSTTSYDYFLSQVGLDWDISIAEDFTTETPVYQTIIQEPVGKAGIFKPIGSANIDNDLFVWSCITDDEPLKVDLVNSQQAGQMIVVNTVPFANPYVGLQHVYISGTNNGMDGAWLAQNSAGSPYSYLLIGSQWTVNSAGGTIHIGTEAIGEIGVAMYSEFDNSFVYTRLVRSRKFNFITKKQIDARPTERNIRSTNLYWTDNFNRQKCMYYKGAYVQDGFIRHFNPTNGLYSYNTIDLETNSQVVGLFTVDFVDQLDSGGALKAGNHTYVVRAKNGENNKTEISLPCGLINVYSNRFSKDAFGDEAGTATSKINRLRITDIPAGVFERIELIDILYSSSFGLISATIVNSFELDSDTVSLDVQHTGNETGSFEIPISELEYLTQVYKTVKSNQVIDNRMVGTNVTFYQDKDFREFAKTFQHEIIELSGGGSGSFFSANDVFVFRNLANYPPFGVTWGTDFKFSGYKEPGNVNRAMSFMLNETYRLRVVFKMKDSGQLSPSYWIDDICINSDAANNDPLGNPVTLPNRRVPPTSPTVSPYRIQDMNITYSRQSSPNSNGKAFKIEFSGFDVGFLIDGKPVYELVDEMYIFVDKCVPEILFNGVLVPSAGGQYSYPSSSSYYVQENGDITDYYDAYGGTPNGAGLYDRSYSGYSQIPAAPNPGGYRWFPGQFAFYSPDHDMVGNNLDGYRNGDYILNYGAMEGFVPLTSGLRTQTLPNSVTEYNSGIVELYALANGITNGNINFKQVMPAQFFNGGGYVTEGGQINFLFGSYSKVQKYYDGTRDLIFNLADSWVFDPNAILDPLVTFTPQNRKLYVDTICYAQYYRQIFNNPLNPEEGKYGKFDQGVSYYAGGRLKMSFAKRFAGQPFPSSGSPALLGETVFFTLFGDVFTTRYLHKIKTPVKNQDAPSWVPSGFDYNLGAGGGLSYFCQMRHNGDMVNRVNSDGILQFPQITYTEWLGSFFRQKPKYDPTYNYHAAIKGIVPFTTRVKDYVAPTRTIYSSLKPQDGTYDGYRDFQPLNFLDVPLTDGEISHHERINGELFIQQVKKWLKYFFNTRGQLQVRENSTAIAIGDASVLARPPIELSAYGSRNKWSFIKGKSVGGQEVAFIFDLTSKAIIRYAGDGTRNISLENNIDSFIRNNTKFLDGVDTPAWKYGIAGVWNEKRKVAIWTARAINPTKPIWFVTLPYQVGDIVWFGDNNTDGGWEELPAFFECIQSNSASLINKPLSGADWQEYWVQLPLSDNRVYNVWTIEWDELKNCFTTFGTPKPKIYMPFRNTLLTGDPRVSFSMQYEQDIYLEDSGEKGVWYDYKRNGLVIDAFISLVFNLDAQNIKRYLALRINSFTIPFKFNIFTKSYETFMVQSDIETRNDEYYVAVKNTTNDPAFLGQNDQDTARPRGQYVIVKMFYQSRIRQYLTDLMVKFNIVPRTTNK